jgi:chromosomal replication initiator protein
MDDSLDERWRQFVARASPQLPNDNSRNYLSYVHAAAERDGVLTLGVQNELMADLVRNNYLPTFLQQIQAFWDREVTRLEILCDPNFVTHGHDEDELPLFPQATSSRPLPVKQAPRRPDYGSPLNPAMTFTSFLADSSNDEAFFAARQFAAKGGTRFNPIYIHGEPGTGKTHLLTAIGNAVQARNPDTPVLFFNGDEFVTLVIDHIRSKRMQLFRRGTQLEGAILLVDDVQRLSGRQASLDELFNLFNWHQARGARLAFTSDLPANAIKGLPERLRSRMAGGLMMEVQPPLFETRVAIAQSAAETMSHGRYPVQRPVAELLAQLYNSNIRDLVAAVRRLQLRAEFQAADVITMDLAQDLLGGLQARRLNQSPDQIGRALASLLQVEFSAVRGKGRTRRLVQARIWIAGLVRDLTTASQMEIGQLLGRDHSTIHHTLSRYKEVISNSEGAAKRDALKRTLQKELG